VDVCACVSARERSKKKGEKRPGLSMMAMAAQELVAGLVHRFIGPRSLPPPRSRARGKIVDLARALRTL
jgi:hypothetical protein